MVARLITATILLGLAACGSNEAPTDDAEEQSVEGEAAVEPVPAGGFFQMKPGLWKRTYQSVGKEPLVDQVCLDASVLDRVTALNEVRGVYEDCTAVEQSDTKMFGVTYRLQCTRPAKVEVSGVINFRDDVLSTDINANDANGELVSTGNAKTSYVGACPSGMKPGDVADASGKVTGSLSD